MCTRVVINMLTGNFGGKLEVGVGSTGRIELVENRNKNAVYLALDFWPPSHFELGVFAFRIGRSEMEGATLFILEVRNLEMDDSL